MSSTVLHVTAIELSVASCRKMNKHEIEIHIQCPKHSSWANNNDKWLPQVPPANTGQCEDHTFLNYLIFLDAKKVTFTRILANLLIYYYAIN